MTRKQAEKELLKTFKLESFHDAQWEAIDKLLKKERVLLIEKTGFGKSLCYQFPATQFDGVTIIFSPLLSLMRDQVKKLKKLGIEARCINSEELPTENSLSMKLAKSGKLKMLYIAPERQENMWWLDSIKELKISMLVIDEAHCVSLWGHDFRPSYRKIVQLVNQLAANTPLLATTATATPRVEEDIAKQIGENSHVIRGNLIRKNLHLHVVKLKNEDEKLIWIGEHIKNLEGNGIIYTGTRTNTEVYSRWLEFLKIPSIGYNAGMDAKTRMSIEAGLMSNKWKCIVSTNALGMGIDKPDIRFIIHTQIPASPIHYYQEIGRAGRDGLPTQVILLSAPHDRRLPEYFINNSKPSIKLYEKVIESLKEKKQTPRQVTVELKLYYQQAKTIIADLISQRIIRETKQGKFSRLELIPGAKPLNSEKFELLRQARLKELDDMVEYTNTDTPRMKFLCEYLGDDEAIDYNNCDNTTDKGFEFGTPFDCKDTLEDFRATYFPTIEVFARGLTLVNGVSASYYGQSNIAEAINRSKYEGAGDFPTFLIKQTISAFRNNFKKEDFDMILYVPSERSGDLLMNFAEKISKILDVPLSDELVKTRNTEEQRNLVNEYLKTDNVANVFKVEDPSEIKGKRILLIDDIYDSGVTIKEIGRILTIAGAAKIVPLVISKTIQGDME